MKSMKGLSMNKMLGSIKKKSGGGSSSTPPPASAATPAENPEVTAHNSVKAFCESGGNAQSDEVLFLPPIVDAAESSPAAAAECARVIRKFLSKDYMSRPSWQYNAIMLVRILTDNPGETFTRSIDEKFVDTVRTLLKNVKDRSVRQILLETLDDFEYTKMYDTNLEPLIAMWKKEKDKVLKQQGGRVPPIGPRPMLGSPPMALNRHSQNYFAKAHSNNRLPDPVELASRLEEARTSAKLLEQVVMNTPPGEMLNSDLIREFADRCLSASRSLQGYMTSENPAPDNDTMESLIDTNEQLQTALNQHKRAVLNARKQMGLGALSNDNSPSPELNQTENQAPSLPSLGSGAVGSGLEGLSLGDSGKGKQTHSYNLLNHQNNSAAAGSSSRATPRDLTPRDEVEDPFADPKPNGPGITEHPASTITNEPVYPYEPFHPGFGGSSSGKNIDVNGTGNGTSVFGVGNSKLQSPLNRPRDPASDDDDIYEATPVTKGPLNKE